MPIRIKPTPGDVVLINKKYFVDNAFIDQYFDTLKAGVPYIVENVDTLEDNPLVWGITKLSNPETGDVIDIESVPELSDYWCLLTEGDSYRVVPQ